MPTYKKKFAEPDYYEHVIVEHDTQKKIGTLRVKPVSLLWKPVGGQFFYAVSMDDFAEWAKSNRKRVKQ